MLETETDVRPLQFIDRTAKMALAQAFASCIPDFFFLYSFQHLYGSKDAVFTCIMITLVFSWKIVAKLRGAFIRWCNILSDFFPQPPLKCRRHVIQCGVSLRPKRRNRGGLPRRSAKSDACNAWRAPASDLALWQSKTLWFQRIERYIGCRLHRVSPIPFACRASDPALRQGKMPWIWLPFWRFGCCIGRESYRVSPTSRRQVRGVIIMLRK